MAWIESHQSLRNHRKVLTMVGLLGASKLEVIGSLHCLWWWAIDNAPDGLISERDVALLGQAAEWAGDGREYVQSLVASGFLDPTAAGYRLHDWDDYAGKLIDQRTANARRQKEHREREKARRVALELKAGPEPVTSRINNEERNGVVTVTSPLRKGATGPNPTGPDQPLSTNVDSGAVARNGVTNAVTSADSHEVTASHDAPPNGGISATPTLRDRYAERLHGRENKATIICELMALLYGDAYPPAAKRVAGFAHTAGNWGKVLDAVIDCFPRWNKVDDPHDLIAKTLANAKAGATFNGAPPERYYMTPEDLEAKRKAEAEWERRHGVPGR